MIEFSVETKMSSRGDVIIVASGILDRMSVDILEEQIGRGMESDSEFVIIDILGVSFIDSSGIGLLLCSTQMCRERGKELAILNTSEVLLDILNVTGIDDFLLLATSLDELDRRKV
jgi:anti-sigma B factor antagonist